MGRPKLHFDFMSDDIANPEAVAKKHETKKNTSEMFRPNPKNGKNGKYTAVIRFVPNIRATEKADTEWVSKWRAYGISLPNWDSGRQRVIDCPTSIGEPSIFNDLFWALRKSGNVVMEELSKKFSRSERFFSIVQILEDKNDESLEGNFYVFEFGRKLMPMIEGQMNPESSMQKKHNPYHIVSARPFIVVVDYIDGSQSNYSKSAFSTDYEKTYLIDGVEVPRLQTNDPNDRRFSDADHERVINHIWDNAPDLNKYKFTEWSEETTAFVHEYVMRNLEGITHPEIDAILKTHGLIGATKVPVQINQTARQVDELNLPNFDDDAPTNNSELNLPIDSEDSKDTGEFGDDLYDIDDLDLDMN